MEFPHKISASRRRQVIAEAAYFRAERRGFDGGDPVKDWLDSTNRGRGPRAVAVRVSRPTHLVRRTTTRARCT